MKRMLRIRSKAKREYVGAIDYYDGEQAGLGSRFSRAVEAVPDDLSDAPDCWPEVEPGVRQTPVPDWPFTILYQMTRRAVGVIAVFHTSRDPQEWIDRVCDFSMSTGLNSGSRHHVHLCSDEATTTRVGQRHGKPAILTIRSGDALGRARILFVGQRSLADGDGARRVYWF